MPLKQETQNENKETRQHLLECAKREFLEKGYMKASCGISVKRPE